MGVAKDKISTAWKHSSLWLHKKFVHFVALLSRFLVKSGISELQHSANDTLKNDALLHFHFRPVATYHCFWKSIWGYFASNDMISKRIYLVKCQLSSMFLKNNQCTIKIVAVAVHIFFSQKILASPLQKQFINISLSLRKSDAPAVFQARWTIGICLNQFFLKMASLYTVLW